MDKYTVDLDQVLNDFEYSELTDQHGLDQSRSGNKQNSSSIHNNFKNSNVKHSINNVFHSLNEYLSSDITPKNVNIERNGAGEASQDIPAEKNGVDQAIAEPIEDQQTIVNNKVLEQPIVEVLDSSNQVASEPAPDPITEAPNAHDQLLIDEPIIEKCVLDEPITDSDHVIEEPIIDDHVLEQPITIYDNKVIDEVIIDKEESDSNKEEESAEIEITEESIKQKTELVENSLVDLDNDINSLNCVKNALEEICDSSKVGFDDDIDLDESELNKYLEELEKEYESENKTEVDVKLEKEESEEVCDNKKETSPETIDDNNSNSSARPNNLPLPSNEESTSDDVKNVIDLIGGPGSTPYNNVYVSKEIQPNDTKKTENSDSDGSTSPTFSDVSTATTSSCTPSTDTVNDETQEIESAQTQQQETIESTEITSQDVASDIAVAPSSEEAPDTVPNIEVVETVTSVETASNDTTIQDNPYAWLGKQAPLWIPDADALNCMHCDQRFTVIKRRHHCRACGLVLCSKCCYLKFRLDYLDEVARVCTKCYDILSLNASSIAPPPSSSGSESSSPNRYPHPNPNNPLEYCSTVPPHQQVNASNANPPSVMVPVGVLKRKGSNKTRTNKSVMFCDGIRPGSDLTNLDSDFSYSGAKLEQPAPVKNAKNENRNYPPINSETNSFLPSIAEGLPPTVIFNKSEILFSDVSNGMNLVETLRKDVLIFALNLNLFVHVKIINMDCCINKTVWCFSTEGLINVGQDEIVILLELLENEDSLPRDIFVHINDIYKDAVKGTSVKEMGISLHSTTNFLDSKNHAGFVFIRPTFQCLQNVIKPKEPYLIGILIHKWETPWARLFPLRLILRLGAEYRYYPSPIISNRHRDSVFVEIGHTIINLLADFRNFTYTLPQIRGLTIHMEDKNTTVTIPSNRYDQIMKSMNNSSDHILAFAGNFSTDADSHLVCIQDTQSNDNNYSTHAINIHNKPRKVTGASFIVFNGALKSSTGLTAKSSIVEDGLMVQIPPDHMVKVRESLRNMKDHVIQCGCINAASDETVNIIWGAPDTSFNTDVFSPIDNKAMAGIPSIRVHNGKDYTNGVRLIRWTEVFIIQNEGEAPRNQEPIDISKVSETIAKAACTALVKYLDLLVSNNFYKIGIRANLNALFVSYSAGSNGVKLPPIYMESLDNELVPVLHRNATSDCDENTIILELIFRILQK